MLLYDSGFDLIYVFYDFSLWNILIYEANIALLNEALKLSKFSLTN